jgi:hypothetical protein
MIDTSASRQCLNRRLTHVGAVGLALAAFLGLACGLTKTNPTGGSHSGGSVGQAGLGGHCAPQKLCADHASPRSGYYAIRRGLAALR